MKNKYLHTIVSGSIALICVPLGLAACQGDPAIEDDGQAGATSTGGEAGASGIGGAGTGGAGGEGTGGVGGDSAPPDTCPTGVALVATDYYSTEIALLSLDGEIRDPSFLSTASTQTDGLAFPLSGDVSVPLGASGELIVLDRYGTNVVSFVNPKTGDVRAQLAVGMGFESNPYDYLQVSSNEGALVRLGKNPSPGSEKFDDGGDLLFIDSQKASVKSSVVFEDYDGLPPGPSHISRIGDELFVTLDRNALDFSSMGETMLVPVSLETRKAGKPVLLKGLKSCSSLVPVPGRDEVAIACTGRVTITGEVEQLSQSALVFFDAKTRPLKELRRISAKKIAGEPLQNQVVFASDTIALLRTQTAYGGTLNSRLLALDLESEKVTELLEAEPDSMGRGRGLAFGTIHCAPECGDICLMPDSSRNEIVRISTAGSVPTLLDPVSIDEGAGLPPTGLGSY